MNVNEAIAALSANGRKLMETIPQMDFFDEGYVAGSGNWGSNMADQVDFKKGSFSGVINRTVKLGLWDVMDGDDDTDAGQWFSLTELGAAVVRELCGIDERGRKVESTQVKAVQDWTDEEYMDRFLNDEVEEKSANPTAKVGRKWTYLYDAEGELIAELKNSDLELIGAYLRSEGLA